MRDKYVVSGTAKDIETIARQRDLYDDHVVEKGFKIVDQKLFTSQNKDGLLDFEVVYQVKKDVKC